MPRVGRLHDLGLAQILGAQRRSDRLCLGDSAAAVGPLERRLDRVDTERRGRSRVRGGGEELAGARVRVLDEVVDPHDRRVPHLSHEPPLRDRGGQRVGIGGVEQSLEDDRLEVASVCQDQAVHRPSDDDQG